MCRVSHWANVFFFSALLHRPRKAAGYAVPTATTSLCGLLHRVAYVARLKKNISPVGGSGRDYMRRRNPTAKNCLVPCHGGDEDPMLGVDRHRVLQGLKRRRGVVRQVSAEVTLNSIDRERP